VSSTGTWEIGEIKFPFSEAFRFSLENIKKRFTRAAITAASVVLGIAFMNSLMMMAAINQQVSGMGGIELYQYWLLFISLLVCAVGITNSMLIAVTERYKEIGTWKTLGALDKHVLELFLIEASLIGLIGGLVGYIAGLIAAVVYGVAFQGANMAQISAALFATRTLPMPLPTAPALLVLSLVVAVGISLAASLYPAYKGAKLEPAVAFRFEV